MTFLIPDSVKWTLERMCCVFEGEDDRIVKYWNNNNMSELLRNAAGMGQMRGLSKAVLALCP